MEAYCRFSMFVSMCYFGPSFRDTILQARVSKLMFARCLLSVAVFMINWHYPLLIFLPATLLISFTLADFIWSCLFMRDMRAFSKVCVVCPYSDVRLTSVFKYPANLIRVDRWEDVPSSAMDSDSCLIITTSRKPAIFLILAQLVNGGKATITTRWIHESTIPFYRVWHLPRFVKWLISASIGVLLKIAKSASVCKVFLFTWTGGSLSMRYDELLCLLLTIDLPTKFEKKIRTWVMHWIRGDFHYIYQLLKESKILGEGKIKLSYIFTISILQLFGMRVNLVSLLSILFGLLVYMAKCRLQDPDNEVYQKDKWRPRAKVDITSIVCITMSLTIGVTAVLGSYAGLFNIIAPPLVFLSFLIYGSDILELRDYISKSYEEFKLLDSRFKKNPKGHRMPYYKSEGSSVRISRYGTRGDFLPIEYLSTVLTRLGIPVQTSDVFGEDVGCADLAGLERGDVLAPYFHLTHNQRYIGFLNALGIYVIGNGFSTIRHNNSLPIKMQNKDGCHGVTTENLFLDIANVISNGIELEPSGFEDQLNSYPYSSNGKDPLTNRWTYKQTLLTLISPTKYLPCVIDEKELQHYIKTGAKIIICTGSSNSLPEMPAEFENLDIHASSKAWLPQSKGKLITNPDHPGLFRNYKVVISHGGAGTVRTALLSGASVFSVSTKIDRDLRTGPKLVAATSPPLSMFFNILTENPAFNGVFTKALLKVKLLLLSFSVGIFFPMFARPLPVLRGILLAFFTSISIISLSFRVICMLKLLIGVRLISENDLVNSLMTATAFINLSEPFQFSYLNSILRHIFPTDLSDWTLVGYFISATLIKVNIFLGDFGLVVGTFTPLSSLCSSSTFVEIWRSTVLTVFDHTFIRCGDRWYQFVFHETGIGSKLFPRMSCEVLHRAPIGEFKIHRTSIRSNRGPRASYIDWLKVPRRYTAMSNCQTGTLAFLRGCRRRSNEAELLMFVFLTKSSPLLGVAMIHNLVMSVHEDNYFCYPTLGVTDFRMRAIISKTAAGSQLSSDEIAFAILQDYSVRVEKTKQKAVQLIPADNIIEAYNKSRLGMWFPYHQKFSRLIAIRKSGERSRKLREFTAEIQKLIDQTQGSISVTDLQGSVSMRPFISYDSKSTKFSPKLVLINDFILHNQGSDLLTEPEQVEQLLKRYFKNKDGTSYDISSYLTFSDRAVTDQDELSDIIAKTHLTLASNYATLDEWALLAAIASGTNLLIFRDEESANVSRIKNASRVLSTLECGLIFGRTLKLIIQNDKFTIIESKHINYRTDFDATTTPQVLLNTYIPLQMSINWKDEFVSWLPRIMRKWNIIDEAAKSQFYNFISHCVLWATKWVENGCAIILKIICYLLDTSGTPFNVKTDQGTRLKGARVSSFNYSSPGQKISALEQLGINPLIQAPQWEVDLEEPDLLVSPRMMKNGRKVWEYEDIIDNHFNRCRTILNATGEDWHVDPDYRRKFNSIRYLDKYMSERRAMAVNLLQAEIGVNNIDYATEHATRLSLNRYSKNPLSHEVTSRDIVEYSEAIHDMKLPEYSGFRLWTPERSLADLKRKMNLGYGFEGAKCPKLLGNRPLKKRSDLLKFREAKLALLDEIRSDLRAKELLPTVHTSFPKAFKNFKSKLEGLPQKVRTIVTPDLVSLIADGCIFKSTDLEMKRNWTSSSTAIGLPWKATAINDMVNSLPIGNQHFIFDMEDYDALHGDFVPKLLGELYCKGFDRMSVEDQAIMRTQIEQRWVRLQKGGVIYDLNHGLHFPKIRGSSTGSVSVTRPNTEVARFAFVKAFSIIWGKPISEVINLLEMKTMGDDNMLSNLGEIVDPDILKGVVLKYTGLRLKVEFHKSCENGLPPNWDGAEFLSHTIHNSDHYKTELSKAGLEPDTPSWPDYCFVYSAQKLAMRQTVFLNKTNIFKEFDSLKSYMQKAVHHPYIHQSLAIMAKKLIPDIIKRPNGSKFLAKRPILSYEEELRLFYVKMHKAKLLSQAFINPDLQRWRAYVEVASSLVNVMTYMRRSAFNALGAPRPLESSSPLFRTEEFTVEKFVYLSHLELTGLTPSYQIFQRECTHNPFGSVTNPPAAWEKFQDDPQSLNVLLTKETYYAKYQWLSIIFFSIRWGWKSLQRSFIIFHILNSCYTIVCGAPSFWWGVASQLGTLANNRASAKLSGMIPRDPWRVSKSLAVVAVDCIPNPFFIIGLRRSVFQWLERVAVQFLALITVGDRFIGPTGYSKLPVPNHEWRTSFENNIMPSLQRYKRICVHAPTGSGKSQTLGDLLLEQFKKVFYVVPRKSAAENMRGFLHLIRGVPWPTSPGKYVLTGGHAIYRYWKDKAFDLNNSIIVFDEYDERDGSQLILANELTISGQMYILLSATQDLKMAKILDAANSNINVRIEPQFTVTRSLAPSNSSPVTLCVSNYNRARRILIIEPSATKCASIVDSLAALDLEVEMMASGDEIPSTRIIVATQSAEKSVTIPGVNLVIDTGYMIRSHYGDTIKATIDNNTMIQRSGRTGRTCDGSYITLRNPEDREIVSFPPVELALAFYTSTNLLYGTSLYITPLAFDPKYSILHGVIGVLKEQIPIEFTDDQTVAFIGSAILQSSSIEELELTLNYIERGEYNSRTEHLYAFHGDVIDRLTIVGIQRIRQNATNLFEQITFQVVDGCITKTGNTIRLCKQGIRMFHSHREMLDLSATPTLAITMDCFRPLHEKLPMEVTLIKSLDCITNCDEWLYNFTSLLNFQHTGEFISDPSNKRVMEIALLFDLPKDGRSINDKNQVLTILSNISVALSSEVLFLDCSQTNHEWTKITGSLSSNRCLNIVWTFSGQLWFYRSLRLKSLRKSTTISIKDHSLLGALRIPSADLTRDFSFTGQSHGKSKIISPGMNSCAFKVLGELFLNCTKTKTDLRFLTIELRMWDPNWPDMTKVTALNDFIGWCSSEFASVRDAAGLTAPGDILQAIVERAKIAQVPQGVPIIHSIETSGLLVYLYRLATPLISGKSNLWDIAWGTQTTCYGEFLILEVDLDPTIYKNPYQTFKSTSITSNNKPIEYELFASVNFNSSITHYQAFFFNRDANSWWNSEIGGTDVPKGNPVLFGYRRSRNVLQQVHTNVPNRGAIDDFLEGWSPYSIKPPLPSHRLIRTATLNNLTDFPAGIFNWSHGAAPRECVRHSCIRLIELHTCDATYAENLLNQELITAAQEVGFENARLIMATSTLLRRITNISLACVMLRDHNDELNYQIGIEQRSLTNEYYILLTYRGHTCIGTYIEDSINLKTLNYDYKIVCQNISFKFNERQNMRSQNSQPEDRIPLSGRTEIFDVDAIKGLLKDRIKANMDLLKTGKVTKEILRNLIDCKNFSKPSGCEVCLYLCNYIATGEGPYNVYIEGHPQRVIKVKGDSQTKTDFILYMKSAVTHKAYFIRPS